MEAVQDAPSKDNSDDNFAFDSEGEDIDGETQENYEINESILVSLQQFFETTREPEPWKYERNNLKMHGFIQENPGFFNPSEDFKLIDTFFAFFGEDIMEKIVIETNNYHELNNQPSTDPLAKKKGKFNPITVNELYIFIALSLLMPRIRKTAVREYWSTDELLKTEVFSSQMSRDRYYTILAMLHFNDNSVKTTKSDPLIKLKLVIDHLKEKFSQPLVPHRILSIEEGPFTKNRIYFKDSAQDKRISVGTKTYVLCCSATGFILDFAVCVSNSSKSDEHENNDLGLLGQIVVSLSKPYFDKGYILIMNSMFSNPTLFEYLHANGINAFGAVKKHRKGLPAFGIGLFQGEMEYRTRPNMCVLRWLDNKVETWMLSTYHNPDMVDIRKKLSGDPILKPKVIIEYEKYTGKMEKADIVATSISSIKKETKWYKKYFFQLLDLAIHNAFVLFKALKKSKLSFQEYQLQLVKELIANYGAKKTNKRAVPTKVLPDDPEKRLVERHFPSQHRNEKGEKSRRRCVICQANQIVKLAQFECLDCCVGLCPDPCFKIYHTQKKFKN